MHVSFRDGVVLGVCHFLDGRDEFIWVTSHPQSPQEQLALCLGWRLRDLCGQGTQESCLMND